MKWRISDTFWLVVMLLLMAVGTCILPGCGDLILQEDALVADPVGTAQAKEIIMASYGRPGAKPVVFWYGPKALDGRCGGEMFYADHVTFLSTNLGGGHCAVGDTSYDFAESVALAPGAGTWGGFGVLAHELAHQAYGDRANGHPVDIFGPDHDRGGFVGEAVAKVQAAGLMP
jgi:hypothetical protein